MSRWILECFRSALVGGGNESREVAEKVKRGRKNENPQRIQ